MTMGVVTGYGKGTSLDVVQMDTKGYSRAWEDGRCITVTHVNTHYTNHNLILSPQIYINTQ